MSVDASRPGTDSAIRASRIVLAIVLPAIVLAFCLLAFFAAPPASGNTGSHATKLDPSTTGSIRPAASEVPDPVEMHRILSGYGIDG